MNFQSIREYIVSTVGKVLKYFKRNFKDSSYGIANLLIASLDGFFLNVLLVRFLSYEDLGNYKLFFSVLNILILFSINGLGTSVTKAVAKRFQGFFKKAITVSALFSLIASAILIILAFSYYKDSSIKWALLVASFVVPIYFGFNTWEPYYYGKRRFKTVFLLNTLMSSTRFVICAVIIFFYRNYFYAIIAYLLIVSVYNLIFFFWIVRRIKPEETDKKKEKDYLKHGFRLTGSSAISVIATNIERIILDSVSGATMVGIYSVVTVFPTFIKNSLKTLVNVPMVKLAARPEKENRTIIKKGLIIIFLSGIIILVVLWFIIPFLLKFFFKIDDPDIIRYGRLLLIPLIFMPVNLTIKYLASYQGTGVSVLKLYTSVDAIKLILLAIFVPLYKIEGIIIALILAEFFTSIILLTWFFRSNKKFDI
ncbi:MAG: oligosaccharide flippase family protein [Candidatus Ratteibacteria bacterium]|nr:oligosaccharide flippase family protein [Candidatus Ratteibacteria bacterium]